MSIYKHANGAIITDIGYIQVPVLYADTPLYQVSSAQIQDYLITSYEPGPAYNSLLYYLVSRGLNIADTIINIGDGREWRIKVYSDVDYNSPHQDTTYFSLEWYTGQSWSPTGMFWTGGFNPDFISDINSRYPFFGIVLNTGTGEICYVNIRQDETSVNDFIAPVSTSDDWCTIYDGRSSSWYSDWFVISYNANQDPYNFDPSDPSSNDGQAAGTGGGTGTFNWRGEHIDLPDLPELDAVNSGFITIFCPTNSQLKNLANYMWDGTIFDLNNWQKCFANPMDAILGLAIVPVNVPTSGASGVTVGNMTTTVSMNKAARQFVSVDCGYLTLKEYWGAYLDYEPYTQAQIYLPYCGVHAISIDEIMNKSIHVLYHVDILSGACVAYVSVDGGVMYQFVGQCSCSIPISGTDFTQMINGVLSIAGSVGQMVATGGATAPLTIPGIASTAVNSMKPQIEKSGAMGGMGGLMAVQKPYIILSRPNQAVPARQNLFKGYPSNITARLGDCSGYTEVDTIHLSGIPATGAELEELENLLKEGVIL